MKKLLIPVSSLLITAVNSFSNVIMNIDGAITTASYIPKGGTYTVNNSGSISFTDYTSYVEAQNSAAARNYFTIANGATFKVTNANGTEILSITGPADVGIYNNLTGAETNFLNAGSAFKIVNDPTVVANGSSKTSIQAITPGIVTETTTTSNTTVIPGNTTTVTTPIGGTTGTTISTTVSKVYIPRSKVDLDLTKNMTEDGFKNLWSNAGKEDDLNISLRYIGKNGKYSDDSKVIKYNSKSNGISFIGSKKINNFTIGGGVGYQKSDVKYKDIFSGTKEKIDSMQFMINGNYEISDLLDISASLVYSHNNHKYKTENNNGIHNAKFNSDIIDFQTRLGYNHKFDSGVIKPYIGVGITSIKEKEIEKLELEKTSGTSPNAAIGVYGESNLTSKLKIFGDLKYEYKLNNKSYHKEREFKNNDLKVEELDYDNKIELGAGIKYKLSKAAEITAAYEKKDKDDFFKLGIDLNF